MMRGTDNEGTMLVVVEMGTDVTAEDICYEGNYLCCFLLGLSTGFLYYGMSTL
jgi:hypothetical protein